MVVPADAPADGEADPVAIVPLMHRHEVEPSDALTHTTMRHGARRRADPGRRPTRRPSSSGPRTTPTTRRSSCAPADLPALSPRRSPRTSPVRPIRRLGRRRPAPAALRRSGGRCARRRRSARSRSPSGWTLNVEREDVCPVVTLPDGVDMDGYLATLGKKERHEIRRKVRRAEAVGEIRLDDSDRPARRPRGVHRPAPEALGRGRALPADTRRRPEPGPLPAAVRAARARTGRSAWRS